jgi:parallel beta-helix repeat protein
MTTPSTPRKAGPLLGTGAQTSWPFTFKVFAASDIAVTIADNLGVETALVLNADYSVTLNSNQDTSPGGTVTYPLSGSALPTGSRLTIIGNLPYDQPLDLPSGGNFSPLALENQLDRLTMQIQQLRENVGRALQLPVTTDGTLSVQLPPPAPNELIGWDSGGNNLANIPLSELGTAIAYGTYRYDTFTGDGTTANFPLSQDPAVLANLDVSISGVVQVPGTDYSLVSSALAFSSAPPNGAVILARYGEALTALPDSDQITFIQSGTGAVARTVQTKLRDTVSVRDFGAAPSQSAANNTNYIQAALTYVQGTGKALEFEEGTYSHNGLVYEGSNLKLIGKNTVLDYTGADDAFVVRSALNQDASVLDVSGMTFRNGRSAFKVLGQGTGIFRKGYIHGCEFHTTTSGMAWFEHCEDFIIDGNRFYNAGDNAIYYSFSRNAVISNNYVLNCQGSGAITAGYHDTVIDKCENIIIVGNEITTNADAPATIIVYQAGIDVVMCSNVFIEGNQISNSYDSVAGRQLNAGIVVEEWFIENVTIQNNKIWNIPFDGIRIGFGVSTLQVTKLKILNNDIMTCQNAVQLSRTFGATIAGNNFRRCFQEAIEVFENCGAVEIVGNTITDTSVQSSFGAKAAIEIAGHGVMVRGNTFIDSEFGGTINSTAASPTYSVDGSGVIRLYQSASLIATITTAGKTWELVKNEINAVANWSLSLYPYCNGTYVEDIRRTGFRWTDNVQQYSVPSHLGSPEPYGYVNVQASATSASVYDNHFKTKSLALPNHHRNTLLYEFTGTWDGKDVNQYGGGRVSYDSAAPVSGTHIIGDIVYNNGPAAGGFIGWVCTASGSPGTWKTFGAISV